MSLAALIVAAIAVLPALGLAMWIWFAIARATDELVALDNFEAMHFNE